MKFEEKFPSLVKYLHPTEHTVHGQHIIDTCLDKQRVKEAIERIRLLIDCDPFAELLLKELGINNETTTDNIRTTEEEKR